MSKLIIPGAWKSLTDLSLDQVLPEYAQTRL
jgi:hypothetical protein